MKLAWLTTVVLLAACGQPAPGNDGAPSNQMEAVAANGADNLQFAGRPAVPIPSPRTDSTPMPAPSASTAPSRDPVSEAPFTDDSAQGAANVVQTYFAQIEARRYRQAWALWRDGGRGSGMSAAAFAHSFAEYADYHAEVGAPGRVDAGAGQRYVTIPVKTYGTLKTSKPFAMAGDVTLHRTGDIDGASAEQKSWRINTSELKRRVAP